MIQIINRAGLTADLKPDTSISIERNNPLFTDSDKLFEDITYNFPSPATEKNKQFYGSGHLVEAENAVYEMDVQVIVDGTAFFAGAIKYYFTGGEFSNLLKVNFGSLADKVKSTKVASIYTNDILPANFTTADMKTVCQNPASYPYSFFPVYNDIWLGEDEPVTSNLINAWDHSMQKFLDRDFGVRVTYTPFFKLKYILKGIMDFLGFKYEGSWIENPENDKIYIYSMINSRDPNNGLQGLFLDSTAYLPSQLTIADFFKIIRERFFITLTFDVFTGIVKMQSGVDILNSSNFTDLSKNITSVLEIDTPEQNGYQITLKPDTNNLLFKDPVNTDQTVFIPTNILLIGNEEKAIELKSSSLKTHVFTDFSSEFSSPAIKQKIFNGVSEQVPQFPLSFIKYTGMKAVSGGKQFPEATAMELSIDDAKWYKFLNDSKKLKVKVLLSPLALSKIDGSTKIAINSKENFFTPALIEKISYVLPNDSRTLIEAEIDCRTLNNTISTIASIVPFKSFIEGFSSRPKVKAYFEKTGFTSLDLEMYFKSYFTGYTPPIILQPEKLNSSTDKHGVGNSIVFPDYTLKMYNPSTGNVEYPYAIDQELRVKTGTPQYAIINNLKYYFLFRDDYWYIDIYLAVANNTFDNRGIWIIF